MILYILYFPFINGLKKLLHFLHFKLMITLLVTCLIINIYFWKFSKWHILKFEIKCFINTGFTCSNKYVKQVVLINNSWIYPKFQRGWGLEFCLFSEKWRTGTFFPKKGRGISRGKLLRESSLRLLQVFVFINPRNIIIYGIYKSNKF